MKKATRSLWPVLGLVMSAGAVADDVRSNIVLYGRLDASVETTRFSAKPTVPGSRITDAAKDTSYWGLRGVEDLGGGLSAYFKLESGFYPDTGVLNSTTAFFSRESFAGLRASLGRVQIGSQYSPALLLTINVDPFQRVTNGSYLNLMQSSSGIKNRGYVSVVNNAVQYISPEIYGVTTHLMYGLGENPTAPKNLGDFSSIEFEFANGPLYAAMTYEDLKVNGNSPTTVFGSKTYTFGTTYDFNVVKFHGYFLKNGINNAGNVNAYSLGLTAPLGLGVVRAAYASRKTDGEAGSKATVASIGYTYYLSKQTAIYTTYSSMLNGTSSNVGLLPSTRTFGLPALGQDVSGLELGIRLNF